MFTYTLASDQEINRVPITKELITTLAQCCAMFETKNDHSLALNSHLLGVYPIKFTSIEYQLLFDVFNTRPESIERALRTSRFISPTWEVANDPLNQLIIYQAHRILVSKSITEDEKDSGLLSLFKILHYKLFTSYINHVFRYGANEKIMELTIKNLNNKFEIIRYGTWKKVIEMRSKDVYSIGSIHEKSLKSYNNDKDVIYILTDIRSRLVGRLKIIQELYYDNHEKGDFIGDYSLVGTDMEGNMSIGATTNVLDAMISNMLTMVQTTPRFIDNELIRILSSKYPYVSPDTLRRVLETFSELASIQIKSGEFNSIAKTKEKEEYYTGVGILTSELLQKTYRYCMLNKVNMDSKSEIFEKTKNLYTSSRIQDPDILKIKASVYYFVTGCSDSGRDITNSSLTLLVILYILVKSMAFL